MKSSSEAESLRNPATYLHAALRAFVSSAYERVNTLLLNPNVFNFGHNTAYPDLATLHERLNQAVDHWRDKNAFVADLIEVTLKHSRLKHTKSTDRDVIVREVFLPLTNHVFCYIKVDRRSSKPVSTVRVLFPVDFDCKVCLLGPRPSELCANSCFRFAFFPYKPEEILLNSQYNGHYEAAQFALADASFAASAPDLNRLNAPAVPIAALMVPLLFGQPLLLADVGSSAPEQYRIGYKGRLLLVERRFTEMNHDLGIRTEAFVPIKVTKRSFMPGFASRGAAEVNESEQDWVPGFSDSTPFCIELYSPMPEWFSRSWMESDNNASVSHKYSYCQDEDGQRITVSKTPVPTLCALDQIGNDSDDVRAILDQVTQILAVGFNLQHYSELMAIEFVEWLRDVLKRGAYDAFAPTLEKLYRQHTRTPHPQPLSSQVQEIFEFIRATPRILGDVLTRGHHGGLLLIGRALGAESDVDLTSIEGIKRLARHIREKTNQRIEVNDLRFDHCAPPPATVDVKRVLRSADRDHVLVPLVVEILMNHGRPKQVKPLEYHLCLDEYQHKLSLHFASPGAEVDLKTYLNLRQGLPQRENASTGDSGGVGVALSRLVAEEYGFDYVIELGRNKQHSPAKHSIHPVQYRRDLHTRIYFGEHV